MSETTTPGRNSGLSAIDIVGHVTRWQTYKNLCYLLLAFPLGVAYGMFVTFGFIFGTVLLIVGVGIGILLVTIGGVRFIGRFERWLANRLLDVTLQAPDDRAAADGLWATIRAYMDAPSTWRSAGFLSLKFWLSVVGIILLFGLATTIELLTAPLRYPTGIEFGTVNDEPIVWTIGTLPEAMAAVPIGVAVGMVLLHLSNGVAYVAGRMAVALLDGTDRSAEVASRLDSIDGTGSADDAVRQEKTGRSGDSDASDDRIATALTRSKDRD